MVLMNCFYIGNCIYVDSRYINIINIFYLYLLMFNNSRFFGSRELLSGLHCTSLCESPSECPKIPVLYSSTLGIYFQFFVSILFVSRHSHTGREGRVRNRSGLSEGEGTPSESPTASEDLREPGLLQDSRCTENCVETGNREGLQKIRSEVASRQFSGREQEETSGKEIPRHRSGEGGSHGRGEESQIRPGRGSSRSRVRQTPERLQLLPRVPPVPRFALPVQVPLQLKSSASLQRRDIGRSIAPNLF